MKTITLTVRDDTKITVDGVEYPIKVEVKLWTPTFGGTYWLLDDEGGVGDYAWDDTCEDVPWLEAGNIFPTSEYAAALDRKRRAESIIFRYFYERGIDTRWKEGETQFGVYISHGRLIALVYDYGCGGSPFYVESKDIAEQAIADIPDAIRTALLGGWG